MAKKFKILPDMHYDAEEAVLRSYYETWRFFNKKTGEGFFALYNSFKDNQLRTLDPGALRLYLYFGFNSNNAYGHSYYGIQAIADFFKVQTRTVDNWIKVLVDENLIYRERKGHKSHTTYLLPLNTSLQKLHPRMVHETDSQQLIDGFLSYVEQYSHIFGSIIRVVHVFQWGSTKDKKPDVKENFQWILLITKRKNGVLTGHYYPLLLSTQLTINQLQIEGHQYFKSSFMFKNDTVTGIALKQDDKLDEHPNDWIELIEDLSQVNDAQLNKSHWLEYGEFNLNDPNESE